MADLLLPLDGVGRRRWVGRPQAAPNIVEGGDGRPAVNPGRASNAGTASVGDPMLKWTFLLLNAVSVVTPLLVQAPPASTGLPTEVVLLNGNQKTQLTGTKPEERSRNVRVLILVFSTDRLTIGGLKSAHRISTGTPACMRSSSRDSFTTSAWTSAVSVSM